MSDEVFKVTENELKNLQQFMAFKFPNKIFAMGDIEEMSLELFKDHVSDQHCDPDFGFIVLNSDVAEKVFMKVVQKIKDEESEFIDCSQVGAVCLWNIENNKSIIGGFDYTGSDSVSFEVGTFGKSDTDSFGGCHFGTHKLNCGEDSDISDEMSQELKKILA